MEKLVPTFGKVTWGDGFQPWQRPDFQFFQYADLTDPLYIHKLNHYFTHNVGLSDTTARLGMFNNVLARCDERRKIEGEVPRLQPLINYLREAAIWTFEALLETKTQEFKSQIVEIIRRLEVEWPT